MSAHWERTRLLPPVAHSGLGARQEVKSFRRLEDDDGDASRWRLQEADGRSQVVIGGDVVLVAELLHLQVEGRGGGSYDGGASAIDKIVIVVVISIFVIMRISM